MREGNFSQNQMARIHMTTFGSFYPHFEDSNEIPGES